MSEGSQIAAGAVQAFVRLASSDSNAESFSSVKTYGSYPCGVL